MDEAGLEESEFPLDKLLNPMHLSYQISYLNNHMGTALYLESYLEHMIHDDHNTLMATNCKIEILQSVNQQ